MKSQSGSSHSDGGVSAATSLFGRAAQVEFKKKKRRRGQCVPEVVQRLCNLQRFFTIDSFLAFIELIELAEAGLVGLYFEEHGRVDHVSVRCALAIDAEDLFPELVRLAVVFGRLLVFAQELVAVPDGHVGVADVHAGIPRELVLVHLLVVVDGLFVVLDGLIVLVQIFVDHADVVQRVRDRFYLVRLEVLSFYLQRLLEALQSLFVVFRVPVHFSQLLGAAFGCGQA